MVTNDSNVTFVISRTPKFKVAVYKSQRLPHTSMSLKPKMVDYLDIVGHWEFEGGYLPTLKMLPLPSAFASSQIVAKDDWDDEQVGYGSRCHLNLLFEPLLDPISQHHYLVGLENP